MLVKSENNLNWLDFPKCPSNVCDEDPDSCNQIKRKINHWYPGSNALFVCNYLFRDMQKYLCLFIDSHTKQKSIIVVVILLSVRKSNQFSL